jgi:hypothetical protein
MSQRHHPALQRGIDALEWLSREHETIRRHLRDYQSLVLRRGDAEQKAVVVGRICDACCLHLQLKDELLYPAARSVLGCDPLLAQLLSEHARCRESIAKLDEMEPQDADFDATVAALGACLMPHFELEREEFFPQLRGAMVDLQALGLQMAAHRRVLQADVTRLSAPAPRRWFEALTATGGMKSPRGVCRTTDPSQSPTLSSSTR